MKCRGLFTSQVHGLLTHRFNGTPQIRRDVRFASNSAVKHLFTPTSTVSDLYSAARQESASRELRNSTLVKLAKGGNYGAADRLRLRFMQAGIEIEHDPVYEQVAMLGMPWNVVDEERLAYFEEWFSLIPRRHPTRIPLGSLLEADTDQFPVTRRFLFASPFERFPAILRFGIICATKGYIQPILKDILPLLIRFAPAEVGTSWLREMERVIIHYLLDIRTTSHKLQWLETMNTFRDLSIKVCCQAGWLSHAMAIVNSNPQLRLTYRTQTLLAGTLRNAGRVDDFLVVNGRSTINDVTQTTSKLPPHPTRELPPHVAGQPPRHTTNGWQHKPTDRGLARHDLALRLRFLNRRLRESRAVPFSEVYTSLSDLHRAGLNPRTLTCLRRRALSAGPQCANPWMEGELRYWDARRKYDQVLKLYLSYCDTTVELPGIFPRILSRIVAQHGIEEAQAHPFKYKLSKPWLVTKSIVRLVPTLRGRVETLRLLYQSYRKDVMGHDNAKHMLSAFMLSFGDCGNPDDAVRVLKDSEPPYLKQLETLAEVLAHAGRIAKVMALLRAVESGGVQVLLEDGRVRRSQARQSIYGRAINGFVRAGLVDPALDVEAMMNRHLGHASAQNENHEETIEGLRALERRRGMA